MCSLLYEVVIITKKSIVKEQSHWHIDTMEDEEMTEMA